MSDYFIPRKATRVAQPRLRSLEYRRFDSIRSMPHVLYMIIVGQFLSSPSEIWPIPCTYGVLMHNADQVCEAAPKKWHNPTPRGVHLIVLCTNGTNSSDFSIHPWGCFNRRQASEFVMWEPPLWGLGQSSSSSKMRLDTACLFISPYGSVVTWCSASVPPWPHYHFIASRIGRYRVDIFVVALQGSAMRTVSSTFRWCAQTDFPWGRAAMCVKRHNDASHSGCVHRRVQCVSG